MLVVYYELFSLYLLLLLSVICTLLTFWVVFRVEKRLDTSFKFLLIAIIIFSVGVLVDILRFYNLLPPFPWETVIKGLFLIFFLMGIYEMSYLIKILREKNISNQEHPDEKQ